jgi:hypothetical protein
MNVVVKDCTEAGLSGVAADLYLERALPQPDLLCLSRRKVIALRDDLTRWLEQNPDPDVKRG